MCCVGSQLEFGFYLFGLIEIAFVVAAVAVVVVVAIAIAVLVF